LFVCCSKKNVHDNVLDISLLYCGIIQLNRIKGVILSEGDHWDSEDNIEVHIYFLT